MCGLTGFWTSRDRYTPARAAGLVEAMRDSLRHRGPDDAGSWLDPAEGIAFGFRRLSILDLTPAGHQPMESADGRFVVMMNGEIYNFTELRAEVEAARPAQRWRGRSDTEALVEAISLWGVEAALGRANGMFALAIWDRRERVLSLARDRIGKKPLYYGWGGDSLLFGSELKALRAHPGFNGRICADALAGFLRIGYLAGRRTIFAGISKLPGGHLVQIGAEDIRRRQAPEPRSYWSLHGAAMAGLDAQASGRAASQEELEALLRDAVARRMVADVPVGAFLSGGIDSSLVTAVMARDHARPVHSFAIGLDVPGWDEAPHARAVAAHLGTQHEELYVSAADMQDIVRDMAEICDEPLADDSIIPTTLLCRLARRSVTVALSGDGGDELFAGYARYAAVKSWLERSARLPEGARRLAGTASHGAAFCAEGAGGVRAGRRLRLLGCLLESADADRVHRQLVSQTLEPGALLSTHSAAPHPLADEAFLLGRSGPVDRMTFTDMASYLTDDILTKVDRASMSVSLEVRCPLLDYRVIEMSWRFPEVAKLRGEEGKLPLRAMLEARVPRALTDRPKRGFGAPVEAWLRRELREWGEELMSPSALARHGMLDVAACRKLWTDFQDRGHSFNRVIWNLLVFQAWHETLEATRHPLPAQPWSTARDVAEAHGHSAPM